MTLTEFLLARIAEDEAAARAVDLSPDTRGTYQRSTNGGWPWVMYTPETAEFYVMRVLTHSEDGAPDNKQDMPAGEHFRRFSPARVLAECAAKRKIVADRDASDRSADDDEWSMGYSDANYLAVYAIAAIYADHPDFQEAWRP